jgi:hypothetical protein
VVQSVLDFIRLWASHHFPRLLRALSNIQADVFIRAGLRPGNYELFANRVENLFLDSSIVALDEYGIPLELGRKLERFLKPEGILDTTLERLRLLDPRRLGLSTFEQELIIDAQLYL